MTDEELADIEANADDAIGTPERIRYLVTEVKRLRDYKRLITGNFVIEQGMLVPGETKLVGDAYITRLAQHLTVRLKTLEEAKSEGAKDEREACAKVAEEYRNSAVDQYTGLDGKFVNDLADEIATSIRSRGD